MNYVELLIGFIFIKIFNSPTLPYPRGNKKKSVSGTKSSVSVPSKSEFVSRNKTKIVSEK